MKNTQGLFDLGPAMLTRSRDVETVFFKFVKVLGGITTYAKEAGSFLMSVRYQIQSRRMEVWTSLKLHIKAFGETDAK